MYTATPESVGIRSEAIHRFLTHLEQDGLSTHDVILYRRGKIVFEHYWEPFHPEFLHRMYSVTKSFVSLAIGALVTDGMIALDDPIEKFFPKEAAASPCPYLPKQTVRQMLTMTTANPHRGWFEAHNGDRVKFYFDGKGLNRPGMIFEYDSTGSFILGSLVERVTGEELMTYLRRRLLDRIGFSKEAYMLKCPGGHSWSDSALLCTPRDLLLAARLCMAEGEWEGEQLIDRDYMRTATSKQVDNNNWGTNDYDTQGYGYQIWRTFDNSFCFCGMGCQYAICVPDKDMILIYNGDNQGLPFASPTIFNRFFEEIARPAADDPLAEDPEALRALTDYAAGLKLFATRGALHGELEHAMNGVTYRMDPNPMGIAKMRFDLAADSGVLTYENARGEKVLPFGLCKNAFASFPEDGYDDGVGGVPGNRRYNCAASAAWVSPYQLLLRVQIIDTYFGNLSMSFGFTADGEMSVHMQKCAEHFLEGYEGYATGKRED
jgi:CubicO group peptidase (beta-lactamase class C family)